MKRMFICLTAAVTALTAVGQSKITQEHKDRAAEVVKQMTLEEKIDYIGGYESWYVRAIPRLGLPAIRMADGPQGVRNNTKSTLYPSGIAAAATWDRDLIHQMGVSLGKDSRARGVHILLGPGANIYRSPLCGRNFEYFGEDPYLSGEIASSYIKGVQSQNVLACIKHFAGNNQEWSRHTVSSDIDVRTLHEIYFPAFEKAVKEGDVATIMTSYNLLNSVHASESKYLNYDVLRDMWGFDGLVMSDWISVYSPLNAGYYGVDLEMPTARSMAPDVMKKLVEEGVLDVRAIDRKCQHIIQTIFAYGFDKTEQLDKSLPENNPYCDSVAHELSRAAVVMLKNEGGFLPKKKGKFVICGPNADKIVTGGGSGFVTPLISCSVAEGMMQIDKKVKSSLIQADTRDHLEGSYADKKMTVKGVKCELFGNAQLAGEPISTEITTKVFISNTAKEAHEDMIIENMSSRHTFYYKPVEDETYKLYLNGNDGCRLILNGEKVIEKWSGSSWQNGRYNLSLKAGVVYEFIVEQFNASGSLGLEMLFEPPLQNKPDEMETIRKADCVVVCLGHTNQSEKENSDRTFELPEGQVDYLKSILEINKNVVVVVNAGGAVEMASWLPDVKAVLMAWYPGQQGGLAISEIITGKVNPCGKLPISMEKTIADNPASDNYYENVDRIRTKLNPYSRVEYREGLFVGYRGYEKYNVQPLFPFGYGLSYTSFEYSDIAVNQQGNEYVVSFDVRNAGKVAGAEVAQVYVGDDECYLMRPAKELKGFEKVYLKPGETRRVNITLDDEAFRFFDPMEHKWVIEPGTFKVHVGSSSADIRLTAGLTVK